MLDAVGLIAESFFCFSVSLSDARRPSKPLWPNCGHLSRLCARDCASCATVGAFESLQGEIQATGSFSSDEFLTEGGVKGVLLGIRVESIV
jgi:hypothetical protein